MQATLKSETGESWTFAAANADAPAPSARELLVGIAEIRKGVNSTLSSLVSQDCSGVEKRRRVNANTVAAADAADNAADDDDGDAADEEEDDDDVESNDT
jgi:hypothetical protein